MKRISIIARNLKSGGVLRFIENILRELNKMQNVKIFLLHNYEEFNSKYSNIENVFLATQNKLYFDYYVSLRALMKIKPDYVFYTKNIIPLSHFLLKARKVPIIHDLAYFKKEINAYKFLDTLFMTTFMGTSAKFGHHIAAVSNATKNDIVKQFSVLESKVTVINEGVESDFKVLENINDDLLLKYKIKKPFIFYTGSISPRKNLIRMIKAFNLIKDKVPYSLCITGSRQWNFSGFDGLDIDNDRVKIIGFVSEKELVSLYNLADIYLFPSLYEGFGLPILEAQACGCPVITSEISSCPEVAGDAAIIVNPYSVDEIAESIVKLHKNKELQQDLITKGFENIKRYSWKKTSEKLIEIVE